GFVATPDDLGHHGLAGRAHSEKLLEVAHEDHGADHDQVPLRHCYRADPIIPVAGRPPGDHAVDVRNQHVSIFAVGAPQIHHGRLLSLAAIRDVPVPGDQPEQQAELFVTAPTELTLAGLDEQLIARLQILELD